jgi:BlaI family transcriptional regulator, penicillinase repressor
MTRRSLDDLGPLQREVMEVVWELGEASVHEVRERVAGTKRLAYTTVLSVMQKLEKLGWLRHRRSGRTYIYEPTRTRETAGSHSLGRFVDRIFGGDALSAFRHLLDDEDLTADDLMRLRRMIDARRKEQRDG